MNPVRPPSSVTGALTNQVPLVIPAFAPVLSSLINPVKVTGSPAHEHKVNDNTTMNDVVSSFMFFYVNSCR